MNASIFRIVLLLFAVTLIAACAAPDRVVRLYRDAEFVGGPFSSVLVVGVHEDADMRRRFEESVVRYLTATDTDAASSIEHMGAGEQIDRESLIAAANAIGSDAVLITRLLDVQTSSEIQQGRSTFDAERRSNVPLADFFRYDYAEYQDPMSITTVRTVVLATDLYNLANEAKIWSVESTSFDKASVDAIIDGASRGISGALATDGLID